MTGEKEYEHEVEFDDLRSSAVADDEESVIDLGEGEEGELDAGGAKPGADESPDDDGALDLDAILGPSSAPDERYDRIESQLTEKDIRDRQTQAVSTTQSKISALDAECKSLRDQLKAAREKGDTDQELSLEEQLDDKRLDLREQRRVLAYYESEDFKTALEGHVTAEKQGTENDGATRRQKVRETLQKNPAMAQWVNKNRWFLAPKTPEQRAAVAMIQGLDERLLSKTGGYNQQFFAEVNRSVSKRFPELVKVPRADSAPPSGGGEQGGHRRSAGGRVVITADDKRTMRQFGLDPSNPKHVREFALGKR